MTNEVDRAVYLASLPVPSEGIIARISRIQLEKEKEIQQKYRNVNEDGAEKERREEAAGVIQVREPKSGAGKRRKWLTDMLVTADI